MILTLMLIILTATLVIVIIGFVMDRIEIRKIKSGMRTLNKRIKALETDTSLPTVSFDGSEIAKAGREYLGEMSQEEDVTYEAVDSETETETGSDVSAQTND